MILLCVETSLSLLIEISSIKLAIELNFLISTDSTDSFCDKTFKQNSSSSSFNYYASLKGWMKLFITYN